MSLANWSISSQISIALVAFFLVGCSGTEPNVIYNQKQANEVVDKVAKLTTAPIQKYFAGAELTDSDKNKLTSALPLIEEILHYDPVTLDFYNLKGKIFLATGKPSEAKFAFLDGIALSVPRDDANSKLIRSDTFVELAKIHYQENDFTSAERASKNAIALQDDDPMPHVILGRIHQTNKDLQAANDEALRALLINADSEPARLLFRDLNPSPKVSP